MRLLAISFALAAVLVAVPAAAVDRLVDDGLVPCLSGKLPLHGTISAAVAAAAPGETILVCAGKYSDNVVVPKADLTLKGQGLVRVVAATSADPVFTITAPGVTLQNLDLSGSTALDQCAVVGLAAGGGTDLRDLRVHDNSLAVCFRDAGTGNRIRDSVFENHFTALLVVATGVEIANNTVSKSTNLGLNAECSGQPITVDHNAFERSRLGLFECAGVISNNTIRGPVQAFPVLTLTADLGSVVTRNLIQQAPGGVLVRSSSGGTISFNSISFTGTGLEVSFSTGVTVTRNNVSRSSTVDCTWDSFGVNVLTSNNCGTQVPPGAFD